MNTPIRLGIAGLGTVGVGIIKIIQQQANLLANRTGRNIEIAAVSALTRHKDRGVSLNDVVWENSPDALAKRDDIDIFVEVIGGSEGVAKQSTKAALDAGKDVVTANKALIAIHGQELAEKAEARNCSILYEAAVAGGIPIIKTIREGLAGNQISRVLGVINGTCNYILTRMEQDNLSYQDAFNEADELNYLEADPSLDVGGIDSAHKLAILSAVAFGTQPDFQSIEVAGIERINIDDIHAAADMGFKIKLLGVTQCDSDGLIQRVHPCLVPATSPLGQIDGGTNMVVIEGDSVGRLVLQGLGAGQSPTASAIVSDICDLALGQRRPIFGRPSKSLIQARRNSHERSAPYYMRLSLLDQTGALARVTSILAENGISIDRMRQYGHSGEYAPVLIVTHKSLRTPLNRALKALAATKDVVEAPIALKIELP
ncbi:MAG: homoserine dehydrogenase [Aestuariivita sp.]|nr:homoserine dehydrogenase [Aestuariivita sp.]MCY4202389.1 homoserine dehydrogenase [Aestuariivita sp.]MCY4288672.1 homoserine dehydrogenase [Aestuariivita sp.]MCY4345557.1 homoserine dehydrogenase [Aestuariivita sp.]